MKKIITSIAATGILLKVLFNTDDLMTRIVVVPFLVFRTEECLNYFKSEGIGY